MAFGEITEVVPWDVLAHDCGQDLSAPQVAVPRAFKSHATWPNICKGGRYLYVARDPVDAFYSFYKFLPAYTNLQPGDLTQEQFADAIFAGASHSGQIWDHFIGWWEQRHNPDVMWLFYEDLKDDLPGVRALEARARRWGGVAGLRSGQREGEAACGRGVNGWVVGAGRGASTHPHMFVHPRLLRACCAARCGRPRTSPQARRGQLSSTLVSFFLDVRWPWRTSEAPPSPRPLAPHRLDRSHRRVSGRALLARPARAHSLAVVVRVHVVPRAGAPLRRPLCAAARPA
eukprot:scaffold19764_cov114-Isochrysis_galbana.AAC.8